MDKLSASGIGLGTVTETLRGANKTTQEIVNKSSTHNSLSPLRHFPEHLVRVFEKLLRENNLDHNSSRLSTRWLETHPAITCKNSITPANSENDSLAHCHSNGATGIMSFLKNRTGESIQFMPLFCSKNQFIQTSM
jgi:hypothetical protein